MRAMQDGFPFYDTVEREGGPFLKKSVDANMAVVMARNLLGI